MYFECEVCDNVCTEKSGVMKPELNNYTLKCPRCNGNLKRIFIFRAKSLISEEWEIEHLEKPCVLLK